MTQKNQEILEKLCQLIAGTGLGSAGEGSKSQGICSPEDAAGKNFMENQECKQREPSKILDGLRRDEAFAILKSLAEELDLAQKVKRVTENRPHPQLQFSENKYAKYSEIFGHNGIIERLAFDNSSKFAFSASVDGLIKIWSIPRASLVHTLYGHRSPIVDLSVSPNGEYLVSADISGHLLIWSLKSLELVHRLKMEEEIIFSEFYQINSATKKTGNCNNITCILNNGIVKTIKFNSTKILETKESIFLNGEGIKAICITDGGRFLICGGWSPFLLLFDIYNLDSVFVLEGCKVQTVCASKNNLKIAASINKMSNTNSSNNNLVSSAMNGSNNALNNSSINLTNSLLSLNNSTSSNLYSDINMYTYYSNMDANQGNFLKRKNSNGAWQKITHRIMGVTVEGICFLSSYLLVALTSDDRIRIYDDFSEVASSPCELGCLYSHPFKNIFAVVGNKLTMYELTDSQDDIETDLPQASFDLRENQDDLVIKDKKFSDFSAGKTTDLCYKEKNRERGRLRIVKILEEPLSLSISDCCFSDDGKYFIMGDERGNIITYAAEGRVQYFKEQFFLRDFNSTNIINGAGNEMNSNANRASESINPDNSRADASFMNENQFDNGNFDICVNENKIINQKWDKINYTISSKNNYDAVETENRAALTFEKEKIKFPRFERMYLGRGEKVVETEESNETDDRTWEFSSENSRSTRSGYDASNESESNENDSIVCVSSNHESLISSEETVTFKRRFIVDEESSEDKYDQGVLLRRRLRSNEGATKEEKSKNKGKRVLRRELKDNESIDSSVRKKKLKIKKKSESKQPVLRSAVPSARKFCLEEESSSSLIGSVELSSNSLIESSSQNKIESKSQSLSESSSESIQQKSKSQKNSKSVKNSKSQKDSKTQINSKSQKNSKTQIKSSRRILRKDSHSNTSLVESTRPQRKAAQASKKPSVESKTKESRSHKIKNDKKQSNGKNEEHNESIITDETPKRRILRHSAAESDENNHMVLRKKETPSFADENQYALFSKRWMSTARFYKKDRIFFSAEGYLAFTERDSRLGPRDVPETGVYEITEVDIDYIGAIPYYKIELNRKYRIAFYEYEESTGIVCLEEQYKAAGEVELARGGTLINEEIISEVDGLCVQGKHGIFLRLEIVVRGELAIDKKIEYETKHRIFFGRLRNISTILDFVNYETIDFRLKNGLYRKMEHLKADLRIVQSIGKNLGKSHEEYCKDVTKHLLN
ncbi:hypothetical protein ENBRE01_1104 [Enteropsectra breve]|nr:hypothetical protein ENBRE01_1104 [Enteropsectra breve]